MVLIEQFLLISILIFLHKVPNSIAIALFSHIPSQIPKIVAFHDFNSIADISPG